ncbi:MAG: hypothetical protein ACREQF_06740, partial [Candidatus Binataceae bacterium]
VSCSSTPSTGAPDGSETNRADQVRTLGPTSKVALLGPQFGRSIRTPGTTCVIRGYLTAHPALPTRPATLRDGREVPVLSFVMTVKITDAIWTRSNPGGESMLTSRGKGKLRVYYDPDGIDSAAITGWNSSPGGAEIEEDDVRVEVEFRAPRTYWVRVQETAVATEAFSFRGLEFRMPTGRSANDLLRGEAFIRTGGLALASRSTLASGSPATQLDSLFLDVKY